MLLLIYANDNIDELEKELLHKDSIIHSNNNNILNDTSKRDIQINELYTSKNMKIKSRKLSIPNIQAIDTKELRIHCHLQANHSKSLEMHIVMIYDIEQSKMLKSLSVLDYKKNYKTLLRENVNSLSVFAVEVIPGKSYNPIYIPIKNNAILIDCMIFVFLMDKDAPPYQIYEAIPSGNIFRKVMIGSEKKIILIINRNGAFIRK